MHEQKSIQELEQQYLVDCLCDRLPNYFYAPSGCWGFPELNGLPEGDGAWVMITPERRNVELTVDSSDIRLETLGEYIKRHSTR